MSLDPALTVTVKVVVVVKVPSDTEIVMVAVPVWPEAGVIVTVRFPSDPPITTLLFGMRVVSDEDPVTVRLPADVSGSLTVKEIAEVAVPEVAVWLLIEDTVGGRLSAERDGLRAPKSLKVVVEVVDPLIPEISPLIELFWVMVINT